MSNNTIPIEQAIELWKKNNVTHASLEFTCGGDSMGDMSWYLYNTKDKIITGDDAQTIETYLHNAVFDNVEFYEVSDGEYLGESGTVTVELDDDQESFTYTKNATQEICQSEVRVVDVKLTKKEIDFINEYVRDISGEESQNQTVYSKDFIMTEEIEQLVASIEKKLNEEACEYPFDADGEWNEYYNYTTVLDGKFKIIEDNSIKIEVTKNFYIYVDSE